jgi:hypothetical protein
MKKKNNSYFLVGKRTEKNGRVVSDTAKNIKPLNLSFNMRYRTIKKTSENWKIKVQVSIGTGLRFKINQVFNV